MEDSKMAVVADPACRGKELRARTGQYFRSYTCGKSLIASLIPRSLGPSHQTKPAPSSRSCSIILFDGYKLSARLEIYHLHCLEDLATKALLSAQRQKGSEHIRNLPSRRRKKLTGRKLQRKKEEVRSHSIPVPRQAQAFLLLALEPTTVLRGRRSRNEKV